MGYKVADNTYGIAEYQTKLLEILVQFINICEQYDLIWWADGGTCIGALRNGGFVPWDDDLDVAMPRPDFERLWSLRDEINKNGQYILTRTDDRKNYHHRVIQLVDVKTTFIHKRSENEDIEHGVYIDILPMDACAPTRLSYYRQIFNAILFSIYNVQCLPEYHEGGLIKHAVSIALKLIPRKETRYKIWKHCEKKMTQWDWNSAERVIQICSDTKSMRMPYDAKWFKKTRKQDFENISINLPIGVEKYLTTYYGDYMSLPPEDERHPVHNTVYVDMQRPYKDFKGIYYCVENAGKR